MEFRDLKTQYQTHKADIERAIGAVLQNTNFISGSQVAELEEKLAEYVGVKYCISCANGTDALQLALMAWGIGAGDAVFVPDFTFFSSGEVVPVVGATPIFVDVCADTFNMDPNSLKQAIKYVKEETNLRPRVVIAVDLFGQPADFDRIRKIADQNQMYVLEDGAQGFGGSIGNRRACSFGDISTTSFFPAKPLGCYGDGGAIFTNNEEWAELLRSYRVHGKGTDKYDNVRIGMNSRLDTLQAAVLLEKLKFFDEEVELCNHVAEEYTRRLREKVTVPVVRDGMRSSWAQYTIRLASLEKRDGLMQVLKQQGIPSAVYYKKPMHEQKAFQSDDKLTRLDCSNTERLCNTVLSLPMSAYVDKSDMELIVNTVLDGI